ncbi:MAG: T9SS type A sorting domain-containing protein, partial [Bacteroidales bacterium]
GMDTIIMDCNKSIRAMFTMSSSTKINENNNDFAVYPNPSSGNITISSPVNIEHLLVYNQLGVLCQSKFNVNAGSTIVTLEKSGLYFLLVKTSSGTITKKIESIE